MFDGLSPEVDALLQAAKSDLPVAHPQASLLAQMATAVSENASSPVPSPRRRSLIGKVLTAKAAAIVGVLVLTGGAASAATGSLPGPVQDTASHAAEHVGLHIPKSSDSNDSTDDNSTDPTSTTVAHPDNHGNDVSTVAHDDSTTGADHGSAVCTVASDGKCQPDTSGQGKSADHRQDGSHRGTDGSTTTTTVSDNSGDGSSNDTTSSDSSSSDSGSTDGSSHSQGSGHSGGHSGSDG